VESEEAMSEIAPCPNPECQGHLPWWKVIAGQTGYVRCGCGLRGPITDDPAAAIAAWNSISMGWHPAETAPKDGRDFLGHNGYAARVYHFDKSDGRWKQSGDTCDNDSDGSPPPFWHPIPPLPEGK
jgi:hypothetical protein